MCLAAPGKIVSVDSSTEGLRMARVSFSGINDICIEWVPEANQGDYVLAHAIMKFNLQEFLPDEINLRHGPGCPVCIIPLEKIDKALAIAAIEDVVFTSFGDMIRRADFLRQRTMNLLPAINVEWKRVHFIN